MSADDADRARTEPSIGRLVLALAGGLVAVGALVVAAIVPLYSRAGPCPVALQPCASEWVLPTMAMLMIAVPFAAWVACSIGILSAIVCRALHVQTPRLGWARIVGALGFVAWMAGLVVWFATPS